RLFRAPVILDAQQTVKSPYLAPSPLSIPGIKPCQRFVEKIRALIDSRVEYVYPLLTYVELVSARVANKNPVALSQNLTVLTHPVYGGWSVWVTFNTLTSRNVPR